MLRIAPHPEAHTRFSGSTLYAHRGAAPTTASPTAMAWLGGSHVMRALMKSARTRLKSALPTTFGAVGAVDSLGEGAQAQPVQSEYWLRLTSVAMLSAAAAATLGCIRWYERLFSATHSAMNPSRLSSLNLFGSSGKWRAQTLTRLEAEPPLDA